MIELQNISKKFKIPHEHKLTLLQRMMRLNRPSYEAFYALKDINLKIIRGEFLGIIGNNGSGKSTLLKIIAGIIIPSSGVVKTSERIASFLDLGAGFQSELSAKENLFLYGAIMGMTRSDTRGKYDSIVSFAELEQFMDTKLRSFSSGMKARLAFSIAIHSEFDTLIVDEALAVGDEHFQKKCYRVFQKFKRMKKTVLFVSHDMVSVAKFCDRTICIRDGSIIFDGKTAQAIALYKEGTDR
jgi:lipopolysaccharide transport system ATP-binding protein